MHHHSVVFSHSHYIQTQVPWNFRASFIMFFHLMTIKSHLFQNCVNFWGNNENETRAQFDLIWFRMNDFWNVASAVFIWQRAEKSCQGASVSVTFISTGKTSISVWDFLKQLLQVFCEVQTTQQCVFFYLLPSTWHCQVKPGVSEALFKKSSSCDVYRLSITFM